MMRRRMVRRPGVGVVGTMAVGGMAYAAGSSSAKRSAQDQAQDQQIAQMQAQQAAQQQAAAAQQYAPPPQTAAPPAPGSLTDEKVGQLKQLADLKDKGHPDRRGV